MELITTHNIRVERKNIKNITLKVKPTCEVILTVPLDTDNKHIEYILKKRNDWISKKIDFFQLNNKIENKEYVSGESFKYLGKNYRLKVIQSDAENVKLLRGYIQIFIKDKTDLKRKQKFLNSWYMNKAVDYFEKIAKKYQPIIKKEVKNIRIRQMKTMVGMY